MTSAAAPPRGRRRGPTTWPTSDATVPRRRSPARAPAPPAFRNQGVWDAVGDLVRQREGDLGRPLRVLDLGGGSGGLAVPLAELGHEVTVVDPSPNALAALERRAADFGVADRVTGRQGDADTLDGESLRPRLLSRRPRGRRRPHRRARRDRRGPHRQRATSRSSWPGGSRSCSPRSSPASVRQAQEALTSPDGRWGKADPLPRRFDVEGLVALLDATGFTPVQVHGVRVFADLVPPAALDSAAGREALTELERAVATHPQYAEALGSLGAGLHAIAQRS